MTKTLIWLEDETQDLPWLKEKIRKITTKSGAAFLTISHPLELFQRLKNPREGQEPLTAEKTIFIIDAILPGVTHLKTWSGDSIYISEAQKTGIRFIELTLRDDDSPYSVSPCCVLTQRWLYDGRVKNELNSINNKASNTPEITLYSKKLDEDILEFYAWLREELANTG